jgi:hypothetical protein
MNRPGFGLGLGFALLRSTLDQPLGRACQGLLVGLTGGQG